MNRRTPVTRRRRARIDPDAQLKVLTESVIDRVKPGHHLERHLGGHPGRSSDLSHEGNRIVGSAS